MRTLDIEIPRDVVGIRLRWADETLPLPAGPIVDTAKQPGLGPVIEGILQRHTNYNPQSNSRVVVEQLKAEGWELSPPRTMQPGATVAAYVKAQWRGKKATVTAYVNSESMQFPPKTAHLANEVAGDVRGDGTMYLYHAVNPQAAIKAAQRVARWCDE